MRRTDSSREETEKQQYIRRPSATAPQHTTMATSAAQTLLSPAELAYLHASLSLTPPIRPDGRSPTHFRPLEAQTNVSPGTNGSARVCFSDGTEAIIGVKAQLEKTADPYGTLAAHESRLAGGDGGAGDDAAGDALKGRNEWLDLSIEIPGTRDDEGSTVFLANMLSEAVLADGEFAKKLYINRRFHWKLCLDVSPLPLLPVGRCPLLTWWPCRSSSSRNRYRTPFRCCR